MLNLWKEQKEQGDIVKKVIIGCTGILSGALIYALRLVAAAILTVSDAIRGGNAGLDLGLKWLEKTSLFLSVSFFILGVLFLILGLRENEK